MKVARCLVLTPQKLMPEYEAVVQYKTCQVAVLEQLQMFHLIRALVLMLKQAKI
jgi:hypothetical protein